MPVTSRSKRFPRPIAYTKTTDPSSPSERQSLLPRKVRRDSTHTVEIRAYDPEGEEQDYTICSPAPDSPALLHVPPRFSAPRYHRVGSPESYTQGIPSPVDQTRPWLQYTPSQAFKHIPLPSPEEIQAGRAGGKIDPATGYYEGVHAPEVPPTRASVVKLRIPGLLGENLSPSRTVPISLGTAPSEGYSPSGLDRNKELPPLPHPPRRCIERDQNAASTEDHGSPTAVARSLDEESETSIPQSKLDNLSIRELIRVCRKALQSRKKNSNEFEAAMCKEVLFTLHNVKHWARRNEGKRVIALAWVLKSLYWFVESRGVGRFVRGLCRYGRDLDVIMSRPVRVGISA